MRQPTFTTIYQSSSALLGKTTKKIIISIFNLIILRIHSSSSMISKNKLMKAKITPQIPSRRDK